MAVSTPVPDELLEKHLTETRFDAHRELIRQLTEGLKEEQKRINTQQKAINSLCWCVIALGIALAIFMVL